MLRRWPSSLLLVAGVLLAQGCNRAHVTTVAMIPKANENIFWQTVHAGAVKASRDDKINLIWNGPASETDIAGEMQIVETMINRHVDAIALAPSDQSAFKIAVDRAAAAGIPVVIYDSGVRSTNYRTFVATDNSAGGAMAADRLGEVLHGKGSVVMVATTPGGASTVARENGFRQELQHKYPAIHILDERFGMASVAQSRTVAENMLTAHPDLDGIFASNESGAEGAAQALKARGSKAKLVGFDSSQMLINLMQAGWVDSLVIQDPFRMGATAVDEAVRAIWGEQTPKKVALPPRLVNSGNYRDPAIQAQLFPDLARYLGT